MKNVWFSLLFLLFFNWIIFQILSKSYDQSFHSLKVSSIQYFYTLYSQHFPRSEKKNYQQIRLKTTKFHFKYLVITRNPKTWFQTLNIFTSIINNTFYFKVFTKVPKQVHFWDKYKTLKIVEISRSVSLYLIEF